MLLLPCQKSEKLMKTLVSKYAELDDRVFDPFVGLYSTGHVCVLIQEHLEGQLQNHWYTVACAAIRVFT